jgi:prepilin-type N-terminal cleavage/methylation domain-containing protein
MRRAFTLIELLVVSAILLLPALAKRKPNHTVGVSEQSSPIKDYLTKAEVRSESQTMSLLSF